MTVTSTANKSGPYILNGVTTTFPRTFRIGPASDMKVIRIQDGIETVLTTGFTITDTYEDTGNVIFSPALNGGELVLLRSLPLTQGTDYSDQARVAPSQVEADLDKAVMLIQDMDERLDRAAVLPVNADVGEIAGFVQNIQRLGDRADTLDTIFDNIGNIQLVADISGDISAVAAIADAITGVTITINQSEAIRPDTFGVNALPGVTDMTEAFQAAASYLAGQGGGEIVCRKPYGPYAISTVDLTGGVSIVGDAEIVPIGVGTALFTASGTLSVAANLTADALRNGTTITVADTSSWAVDDYLILTDDVSYSSTDAGYKNGEMLRVKEITSGTVLTVYGSILGPMGTGNYTTVNGAKVRKVTPADPVRIEGLTFRGNWNSTKTLILLSFVQSPVVRGCHVFDHGQMAIRVNGCINPLVEGNTINRLRDNLGGGNVGYGVALTGPSLGGVISGNHTDFCRHGFTTMGGSYGFPRGFKVCDNIDTNSTVASFDTHAAGSDYDMSDNLSVNSAGAGITIRAPRGRILNNKVVRCGSAGIQGVEENISDVTIQGNELTAVGGVGVQIPVACPNLRIIGNTIMRCNNRAIRVFSSATTASGDLVITDNFIEGFALTAAVEGIVTGGTYTQSRAIIARNTIKAGAGTPTYAIRTVMLDNSDVFNNFAQGTYSTAAYDLGTNVSTSNLTRV